MILALEKNRTTETYGTHHFCKKHNEIVDKDHINNCDLLYIEGTRVTDIVAKLSEVDSIWELTPTELNSMWLSLQ